MRTVVLCRSRRACRLFSKNRVVLCRFRHLRVGQTSAQAEAQSGPAHHLYHELLAGGVPAGVISPMEVLVSEQQASAAVKKLRTVPGVETAALPSGT